MEDNIRQHLKVSRNHSIANHRLFGMENRLLLVLWYVYVYVWISWFSQFHAIKHLTDYDYRLIKPELTAEYRKIFHLTTPTLRDTINECELTNFDVSIQNKGQHVTDRAPCNLDGTRVYDPIGQRLLGPDMSKSGPQKAQTSFSLVLERQTKWAPNL